MSAGLELSVPRQRALLKAAIFGRAFATAAVPRGLLRDVTLKLRLLNALREPDVGVPLTMPQLEALSLPVVVSRCVACAARAQGKMCLCQAREGCVAVSFARPLAPPLLSVLSAAQQAQARLTLASCAWSPPCPCPSTHPHPRWHGMRG